MCGAVERNPIDVCDLRGDAQAAMAAGGAAEAALGALGAPTCGAADGADGGAASSAPQTVRIMYNELDKDESPYLASTGRAALQARLTVVCCLGVVVCNVLRPTPAKQQTPYHGSVQGPVRVQTRVDGRSENERDLSL